jgi:type IV pilus assembly protein PilE
MITAHSNKGFTLVELMAVILIVSILTAVALPLYGRYVRVAAQSAAQAEMFNLAGQLERWRSKNLSYAGFTPLIPFAGATGDLATTAGQTIYLPKGAGATNYTYQIALLDRSVAPPVALATSTGQRWTMVAVPNPNHKSLRTGFSLVLNNTGVRCITSIVAPATSLQPKILAAASNSDAALCGTTTNPGTAW